MARPEMTGPQMWEVIEALMGQWEYMEALVSNAATEVRLADDHASKAKWQGRHDDYHRRSEAIQDLLGRLRRLAKQADKPATMGSV